MTIERLIVGLRNGRHGTFRRLKAYEHLEDGDIEVGLTFISEVSPDNAGTPCRADETIIRLEFDK